MYVMNQKLKINPKKEKGKGQKEASLNSKWHYPS